MQVVAEKLPNSVAKVSVTIDSDDVQKAMDKAFVAVVKKYNIPGFRRGKVPRPIFERFVGRDVILQEAAGILVENRYLDALTEAAITPLADPRISIVELEEGQPFRFDIEVEAKPTVELGDYSELLRTPLTVEEVTDEMIASGLLEVAKSQAQLVPADDEPVAHGNKVVVSLKGFLDDDAEPVVEDEAYTVTVGSGTTVEGFENQLIGLLVNQPATLYVTYPEQHPQLSLAGKSVRFEVTVLENKRLEVPPVNDELAKSVGFESEQELREHVANTLRSELTQQAQRVRVSAILGTLKERVSVELPSVLVKNAEHQKLMEFSAALSRLGTTIDEYLEAQQITAEALHERFRPEAEDMVKEGLILEAVAAAENLTVSDEETVEFIRQLGAANQQPFAETLKWLRESGEFGNVRQTLLQSKASAYLGSTVLE